MYLLADVIAILKENTIIPDCSSLDVQTETVSKINLDETADNYPIHNYADGFQSDIQNTIHKHNEKNEAKQLNNQGNNDFDLNNNCNVLPSDVKSCQRSSNSVVITETATEEKWLQMQFPSHESGDSVKCQLPYTANLKNFKTCKDVEILPVTRKSQQMRGKNCSAADQRQRMVSMVANMEGNSSNLISTTSNPLSFPHKIVKTKSEICNKYYDFKEFLARGRFGQVYRCVDKTSGIEYAAKCMRCNKKVSFNKKLSGKKCPIRKKMNELEPLDKQDVLLEISLMNRLDHPNIINLHEAFSDGDTMTLVFEYLKGGELLDRILSEETGLKEIDSVLFTRQIVDAVQYLHKNLILHLDLKPENILCTDSATHHIKIIDFGFSRTFKRGEKLRVEWGTPQFMAPETLSDHVAVAASDMWSIGVICYVMLSGLSPFHGDEITDVIQNVIRCEWDFDDEIFDSVSANGKDFISRLLLKNDSDRMDATECFNHPWLIAPLRGEQNHETEIEPWKDNPTWIGALDWIKEKAFSVTNYIV